MKNGAFPMGLQLVPQSCSHAGKQLIHAERLGDIIVRSEVESLNLAGLIATTGQNHDWNTLVASPYHSQQIVTLNVRKPEIEDDQVRLFCHKLQRCLAIGGFENLIALCSQPNP
jgi:hypothetical protein